MLIKQLKKILESKSKIFYKKNKKEILDILLFGSVIKGKKNPNDIDILIIFKEKKNLDLTYQLRKIIEKEINLKVEVTGKSYLDLFNKTFVAREAVLSEGYSLVNGCPFSEGLGFKAKVMFNYILKGKTKSERMRFYYSLYGRNSEGILKKLKAVKYTDTIIICPIESQEEMKEFFNNWKIEFKETPLLIPERLV
jgi:predicted nucleotidyltransferase